jgi:hypothetical protein
MQLLLLVCLLFCCVCSVLACFAICWAQLLNTRWLLLWLFKLLPADAWCCSAVAAAGVTAGQQKAAV